MLTIILSVLVIILVVVVAILMRRNRRNVKKVEFLFNALDNGDYTFRFNEGESGATTKPSTPHSIG